MSTSLSTHEVQILGMLLAGDHEMLGMLRDQLAASRVVLREFTGAGFFAHFEVPSDAPRLGRRSAFTISDVAGRVSGVEVGFVLFVRNGALDCLECHTWGDGEISQDWQLEELCYLRRESPGSAALARATVRDESALELEAPGPESDSADG